MKNLKFQNDLLTTHLPSINYQSSNFLPAFKIGKDLFTDMLINILTVLSTSKHYSYILYYSLYLHTTDYEKNLTFHLAASSYTDKIAEMGIADTMRHSLLKLQGYHLYHTDMVDFRTFKDGYDKYALKTLKILQTHVKNVNDSPTDDLIDYKRTVLLRIVRCDNE